MDNSHIHTPQDGRGARTVTVDGIEVERVVFADTKAGIVRLHPRDSRPDANGEWPEHVLTGIVVVTSAG